ncbi:MAG: hypothetical protein QNK05_24835 [Myxococcota bacterium]|nr:hypothetical protein [Myxococcota bacterium]
MNALANLGNRLGLAAIVLAVGSTVLWFRLANTVDLPENRTLFLVVWVGAALLGIVALVKGGWLGRIAAVPAIALGLFLPFTVSISEQVLPPDTIQVGDVIPTFSAPDDSGQVFDSTRLRGRPVLIKFFRAHW